MSVVADRPAATPDPEPESPPSLRMAWPITAVAGFLRRAGSDTALALGALSVITFWTFGLGILLGLGAVATGVFATRGDVEYDESRSLEALFGILSGVLGIAAGAVFLLIAGPGR
ncbi:hypothetical protein ERC79_01580 [Rhodococcus sp. ABRD24]|uniref:hypothetical protein n=1 Tax=Rhodococcus sp. ABRD24 TaxID=2507582 RepID=UPI00103E834B|nr:hypothetical protein [Rhodococcus sp. ABRD24]QBJ94800.1 hypothetical protein ERC79_01580 [Rhodococcus sp. ABRD24]